MRNSNLAVLPIISNETFDVTSGITDVAVAKERRELMEDLRVAVGNVKRSKIEVGRLLADLRDGTPHGLWEPLLSAICNDVHISRATAHRYMEMFSETQFLPPAVVEACKENDLDLQKKPVRSAITAAVADNPNATPAEIVEQVQEKQKPIPSTCPQPTEISPLDLAFKALSAFSGEGSRCPLNVLPTALEWAKQNQPLTAEQVVTLKALVNVLGQISKFTSQYHDVLKDLLPAKDEGVAA